MSKTLFYTGLLLFFASSLNAQLWKVTQPEPLGKEVNSGAEESTPFFSKDSSLLYFTRTLDPSNTSGEWDQDIWFSVRGENGTGYQEAKNLKDLNNKFHNAVVGLSSDGNRIYLLDAYAGKKDQVKGLAVAQRNPNGSWGEPVRVQIPELSIDGNFYGFFVSPDEKTIIISYKGEPSLGEEDLYVSENMNGSWSKPQSLGLTINSPGYEISPFLTPNKDTLFFASNGFGGLGDADIFYSVKQGSDWQSWSKPVNLGAPINSVKFDAYFNMAGDVLYFSSNRDSERSDIYKARTLHYRFIGVIREKESLETIEGAHLVIKNVGNEDKLVEELFSDTEGSLNGERLPFHYKELIDLKIIVEKEGYIGKTLSLNYQLGDTTEIDLSTLLDVNLTKIEEGKTDLADIVDVKPIYFDLNSSYIRTEAEIELNKVVEVMKDNPKIVVELRAHTDSRGSEKYNLWLSDRRAKSSAAYIISQGISPDRISGKGFGQSVPKFSDEEINKLSTEEEKEKLHQQNRRTEFIIVKMNT
ncbi:MAG: OmpA family protein [Brumimicrobium sp.]|nr:OmpA family protein [Brumimicrobium sp.]